MSEKVEKNKFLNKSETNEDMIGLSIRPKKLENFIGQSSLKKNLDTFLLRFQVFR